MYDTFKLSTFDEYEKYIIDKVLEKNEIVSDLDDKLNKKRISVDEIIADETLSKRDFIELIASRRRLGYDESVGGGNKAAEDETDRLYAKNPWKFVEEFLQNADDCDYASSQPQVEIIVDETKSCVEFVYNEKGFSRNDVSAITAFSQSTKTKDSSSSKNTETNDIVTGQKEDGVFYREKTGRKGKGFKSVFSMDADNIIVHIRSNGFCFRLDNKISRIMPIWEEDKERMDENTHIIVELVNPKFDIKAIYPEFRMLFCVDKCEEIFAKSPFLFMHRIKSIHVKKLDKSGNEEFKTEYIEDKNKTHFEKEWEIDKEKKLFAGIANNGKYYEEQFQEGYIKTYYNKENVKIPVVRYTRMIEDADAYRNYSIMSPVLKEENKIDWKTGALFRTFPMSLHTLNMPISIDAPFELNPDRSGIQYRDEKNDKNNASEWNNEVSNNVFSNGGVIESFLLWIRNIKNIRMDKYISSEQIILFNDGANSDGHGKYWVEKVDLTDICRNIPIFKLFAKNDDFVSFNNAKVVDKELFNWPYADELFSQVIGSEYKNNILSDIYSGSPLFDSVEIIKNGFSDGINTYLDILESKIGVNSQSMYNFVNNNLYPFLKSKEQIITREEPNAFQNMKIYFSTLQEGDKTHIVREDYHENIKWIHDKKERNSICNYRVIESSPVDMTIIEPIIKSKLRIKELYLYLGKENINSTAKSCASWNEAFSLIEAAYYYGEETNTLKFSCFNKCVFSEKLDEEYNAFREAGVKNIIPDEEVLRLSKYIGSVETTVSKLKKMGLKSPRDYFKVEDDRLKFGTDILDVLKTDIDLEAVLKDIKKVQQEKNKKIYLTYDEIKNCKKSAILFFIENGEKFFGKDTYNSICRDVLRNIKWNANDCIISKIIIRACAETSEEIEEKNISVGIGWILKNKLEKYIIKIVSKRQTPLLEIKPDGQFHEIAKEEMNSLQRMFGLDKNLMNNKYYKGKFSVYESKKQYIRDAVGNVYLNEDEKGDYKAALEKYANKAFDSKKLKAFNEMQLGYKFAEGEIIETLKNTGDLDKTYNKLEKKYRSTKEKIIGVLSWFRYSGYSNALGNGNISNEKEIEDDYRNDPWKFIYEFIQNVDDCKFETNNPELSIHIDKERIVFEYNEIGFDLEDIKALTKFGDSNKYRKLEDINLEEGVFDREKTGRKGRGFKSVFSLPGEGTVVHISSNGYDFKFIKSLGSIIPIWENVDDSKKKGTRIIVEGFDLECMDSLKGKMKEMFDFENEERTVSVYAPIIIRGEKSIFEQGALFRTLPLEDKIPVPISINAPFDTNSGRSSLDDTEKNSEIMSEITKNILKDFYMELRGIENIYIEKYIPEKPCHVFENYEHIKPIEFRKLIRNYPILEAYSENAYVSYSNASVLPKECYGWNSPEQLCDSFSNGNGVLVKAKYEIPETVKLDTEDFVEKLNRYLEGIALEESEYTSLFKENIYPYLDGNYEEISKIYKIKNKENELSKMKIYIFEMADGEYVRECADEDKVWMKNVQPGFFSYGRYRNIKESSLGAEYENHKWIENQHEIVDCNDAFTSKYLKTKSDKWEQASILIKTILYYEIKKDVKIDFLKDCALDEDLDSEKNWFRTGYKENEESSILKHIITKYDLKEMEEIVGENNIAKVKELPEKIRRMGLRKADDFFENDDRGICQLNSNTIALLKEYCYNKKNAENVLTAIRDAFRNKGKVLLDIRYDDIKGCASPVFAGIFEHKLLSGDIEYNLGKEFCTKSTFEDSTDYKEAYIRAVSVSGKYSEEILFKMNLSDIIERKLGECIQNCKLKNLQKMKINIILDIEHKDYPSAEIDKALEWLNRDISISYNYYTADISEAFEKSNKNCFIFDDNKVILNRDTGKSSIFEFVKARYKEKDDKKFINLVNIVSEQSELKGEWRGNKKEYIKKLAEFRENTGKLRTLLVPNYDSTINDANGNAIDYVLPELLQNINDCKFADNQYERILDIDIQKNTMILCYDEAGFDFSNVYSITAIGQSSKHDRSEGEKGLGFKKVFNLFKEVEIYSNGFYFTLTSENKTIPKWISDKEKQKKFEKQGKTVMVFTVHNTKSEELNKIKNSLKDVINGKYVGSKLSPLFLKNIHRINLLGYKKSYSRESIRDLFICKKRYIMRVYEQILKNNMAVKEEVEEIKKALKTRKKCELMESDEEKEEYINQLSFEIYIPKNINKTNRGKGCIYSTLPTEEKTHSSLFMNIPLELTTGRDGIVNDSEYNKTIKKMLFEPYKNGKMSIFQHAIQRIAIENDDIFMLDYLTDASGKFKGLMDLISLDCEGVRERNKEAFHYVDMFRSYKTNEPVALCKCYTVDEIIYKYINSVDNPTNDIVDWIQENSDSVEEKSLIKIKNLDNVKKIEEFAQMIDQEMSEMFYPLFDENLDIPVDYFVDEYGCIGGDDENEECEWYF